MNNVFYYRGAIHIHSKFSDGTGDIYEISKAAKKAGLDWIIITDHNSMDIEEGFYNGVCVIRGEEISPEISNHYLALGTNSVIKPDEDPQKYVDEVRKQGGVGFVAHPDESDLRKNKAKPIKWLDKSIVPDGVEIWNWFSDWADNFNDKNIFQIAYAYFFRNRLVKGPHIETLKWWDDLNKNTERIAPAIGGVDAHALKISKYILPVKVFPYEFCFKTLANIIVLNEELPLSFQEQKGIIINAIKNGNNIIINRQVRDEIPCIYNFDKHICVKLSTKADIKIFCDGVNIYEEKSDIMQFKVPSIGKYRMEVYLNNKPWIYSNPIIVK